LRSAFLEGLGAPRLLKGYICFRPPVVMRNGTFFFFLFRRGQLSEFSTLDVSPVWKPLFSYHRLPPLTPFGSPFSSLEQPHIQHPLFPPAKPFLLNCTVVLTVPKFFNGLILFPLCRSWALLQAIRFALKPSPLIVQGDDEVPIFFYVSSSIDLFPELHTERSPRSLFSSFHS